MNRLSASQHACNNQDTCELQSNQLHSVSLGCRGYLLQRRQCYCYFPADLFAKIKREMTNATVPYRPEILNRSAYKGKENLGAIEGTRTPTPLRVHGPEPCASANSATMAIVIRYGATLAGHLSGENHNNILQAHRWLSNLEWLLGFGLQMPQSEVATSFLPQVEERGRNSEA